MYLDIRARLQDAAATGEVIGIAYHGGSRPGAFRRITPIQFEGDHVRARCYTSNAVKLFALAKIELRDATSPPQASETWTPAPEVAWYFTTVDEVASYFGPYLEARGWHVEHGPFEEGEALRAYARLKNGKARRTPALVFSYEARTYDLGVTPDGDVVRFNERARVRPWVVRANGKSSSWGRISKAVETFAAAAGLNDALDALASKAVLVSTP